MPSRKVNLYLEINHDNHFMCIEYPGKVVNPGKMLQNFGGIEAIEKVFHKKSARLSLKFRPKDPCCKPVLSSRKSGTALMLNVRRYKKKNSNGKEDYRYYADFKGSIEHTYEFNAFCEYQYLPIMKDVGSGNYKSVVPYISLDHTIDKLKKASKMTDICEPDAPCFLPPFIFSRLDTEQVYNYKDVTPQLHNRPYHASRIAYGIKVGDPIPTKPHPDAPALLQYMGAKVKIYCEQVQKLLDERPIVSKQALQAMLNLAHHHTIQILPNYAYFYNSGPWRTFWCKLGYNPATDPEAYKFQLVDFRIRQCRTAPHIPVPARRPGFSFKPVKYTEKPNICYERRNLSKPESCSTKPDERQIHLFLPGKLPQCRQIFYQVLDIQLVEVQHIVERDRRLDFNEKFGWLGDDTLQTIRDVMDREIKETTKRMYKENFPDVDPDQEELFDGAEESEDTDEEEDDEEEEEDEEEDDVESCDESNLDFVFEDKKGDEDEDTPVDMSKKTLEATASTFLDTYHKEKKRKI